MLVNQCIVRWSRRAGQFAQEGLVLLAHTPASLFFDQHTLIDQHTHNFFNKEWVAFSPALNSVVQHIGKLVRFEQSSNQFTTFLTCKCIYHNRRKIAPSTPPAAPPLEKAWPRRAEEKKSTIMDPARQFLYQVNHRPS